MVKQNIININKTIYRKILSKKNLKKECIPSQENKNASYYFFLRKKSQKTITAY